MTKSEIERFKWLLYLNYLDRWAKTHNSIEFKGMSPLSYGEWVANEYKENYNG